MKIFTTITNSDFYGQIVEDAAAHETDWTVSRHAKVGDLVLLYCTAPMSAIVATAYIATEPVKEMDPGSPWLGLYFADMHSLTMLKLPLSRAAMMRNFPAWRYWKMPRNSVEVPAEFVPRLKELLNKISCSQFSE